MSKDPFRREYRALSDPEKARIGKIKDHATALHQEITGSPANREQSLAITKLEEAIMWAVKAITG